MFFETSFNRANCIGVKASGGVFEDCNMEGTNFTNGDFTGRVFNRCKFDGQTCFHNATVNGAHFIDCTMNGKPMTPEWLYNQGVIGFNYAQIEINQAQERLTFR